MDQPESADYAVYSICGLSETRAIEVVYVGISRNPDTRWNSHKSSMRAAGSGMATRVYEVLAIYPEDRVVFEVALRGLTLVEASTAERELIASMREQYGARLLNTACGGAGRGKRAGRSSEARRGHRVVMMLTDAEAAAFEARAKDLGVPSFLLARWLLTRHPLPGDKE